MSAHPFLRDFASQVIVIAYREDTSKLSNALESEEFNVKIARATYTIQEEAYSRSIKCMLGHMHALGIASDHDGPTIICEADFVPCVGFGRMPLPVPESMRLSSACWLYANRPVINGPVYEYSFQGYSNSPVCYLISPPVARTAARFAQHLLSTHNPNDYAGWDNMFPDYLKDSGVRQLIAHCCYGEHGGHTNPEHEANIRFGTPDHRAEALMSRLAFLPAYADGSWLRFVVVRLYYRCLGLGRALLFRFCRPGHVPEGKFLVSYLFGITRLIFGKAVLGRSNK